MLLHLLSISSSPSSLPPSKGKPLSISSSTVKLLSTPLFCVRDATASSSSLSSYNQTVHYMSHTLNINAQRALSLNHSLRTHPVDSLQSSHELLLSASLSPSKISKIFSFYPELLTHPFRPSFEFLSSVFPCSSSLSLSISRCPRLLLSPVESQLSPAVNFLKKLTVRITPNIAILLVSDVESTFLPKIEFLQSIGFPYKEVKFMLRRSPRIFTYSIEQNLKPKTEFLQNEMNLSVRKEIGRFPQYFSFSLENKIKRRYFLLKESRIDMGLEEMLRLSDESFNQRVFDMKLEMYQMR